MAPKRSKKVCYLTPILETSEQSIDESLNEDIEVHVKASEISNETQDFGKIVSTVAIQNSNFAPAPKKKKNEVLFISPIRHTDPFVEISPVTNVATPTDMFNRAFCLDDMFSPKNTSALMTSPFLKSLDLSAVIIVQENTEQPIALEDGQNEYSVNQSEKLFENNLDSTITICETPSVIFSANSSQTLNSTLNNSSEHQAVVIVQQNEEPTLEDSSELSTSKNNTEICSERPETENYSATTCTSSVISHRRENRGYCYDGYFTPTIFKNKKYSAAFFSMNRQVHLPQLKFETSLLSENLEIEDENSTENENKSGDITLQDQTSAVLKWSWPVESARNSQTHDRSENTVDTAYSYALSENMETPRATKPTEISLLRDVTLNSLDYTFSDVTSEIMRTPQSVDLSHTAGIEDNTSNNFDYTFSDVTSEIMKTPPAVDLSHTAGIEDNTSNNFDYTFSDVTSEIMKTPPAVDLSHTADIEDITSNNFDYTFTDDDSEIMTTPRATGSTETSYLKGIVCNRFDLTFSEETPEKIKNPQAVYSSHISDIEDITLDSFDHAFSDKDREIMTTPRATGSTETSYLKGIVCNRFDLTFSEETPEKIKKPQAVYYSYTSDIEDITLDSFDNTFSGETPAKIKTPRETSPTEISLLTDVIAQDETVKAPDMNKVPEGLDSSYTSDNEDVTSNSFDLKYSDDPSEFIKSLMKRKSTNVSLTRDSTFTVRRDCSENSDKCHDETLSVEVPDMNKVPEGLDSSYTSDNEDVTSNSFDLKYSDDPSEFIKSLKKRESTNVSLARDSTFTVRRDCSENSDKCHDETLSVEAPDMNKVPEGLDSSYTSDNEDVTSNSFDLKYSDDPSEFIKSLMKRESTNVSLTRDSTFTVRRDCSENSDKCHDETLSVEVPDMNKVPEGLDSSYTSDNEDVTSNSFDLKYSDDPSEFIKSLKKRESTNVSLARDSTFTVRRDCSENSDKCHDETLSVEVPDMNKVPEGLDSSYTSDNEDVTSNSFDLKYSDDPSEFIKSLMKRKSTNVSLTRDSTFTVRRDCSENSDKCHDETLSVEVPDMNKVPEGLDSSYTSDNEDVTSNSFDLKYSDDPSEFIKSLKKRESTNVSLARDSTFTVRRDCSENSDKCHDETLSVEAPDMNKVPEGLDSSYTSDNEDVTSNSFDLKYSDDPSEFIKSLMKRKSTNVSLTRDSTFTVRRDCSENSDKCHDETLSVEVPDMNKVPEGLDSSYTSDNEDVTSNSFDLKYSDDPSEFIKSLKKRESTNVSLARDSTFTVRRDCSENSDKCHDETLSVEVPDMNKVPEGLDSSYTSDNEDVTSNSFDLKYSDDPSEFIKSLMKRKSTNVSLTRDSTFTVRRDCSENSDKCHDETLSVEVPDMNKVPEGLDSSYTSDNEDVTSNSFDLKYSDDPSEFIKSLKKRESTNVSLARDSTFTVRRDCSENSDKCHDETLSVEAPDMNKVPEGLDSSYTSDNEDVTSNSFDLKYSDDPSEFIKSLMKRKSTNVSLTRDSTFTVRRDCSENSDKCHDETLSVEVPDMNKVPEGLDSSYTSDNEDVTSNSFDLKYSDDPSEFIKSLKKRESTNVSLARDSTFTVRRDCSENSDKCHDETLSVEVPDMNKVPEGLDSSYTSDNEDVTSNSFDLKYSDDPSEFIKSLMKRKSTNVSLTRDSTFTVRRDCSENSDKCHDETLSVEVPDMNKVPEGLDSSYTSDNEDVTSNSFDLKYSDDPSEFIKSLKKRESTNVSLARDSTFTVRRDCSENSDKCHDETLSVEAPDMNKVPEGLDSSYTSDNEDVTSNSFDLKYSDDPSEFIKSLMKRKSTNVSLTRDSTFTVRRDCSENSDKCHDETLSVEVPDMNKVPEGLDSSYTSDNEDVTSNSFDLKYSDDPSEFIKSLMKRKSTNVSLTRDSTFTVRRDCSENSDKCHDETLSVEVPDMNKVPEGLDSSYTSDNEDVTSNSFDLKYSDDPSEFIKSLMKRKSTNVSLTRDSTFTVRRDCSENSDKCHDETLSVEVPDMNKVPEGLDSSYTSDNEDVTSNSFDLKYSDDPSEFIKSLKKRESTNVSLTRDSTFTVRRDCSENSDKIMNEKTTSESEKLAEFELKRSTVRQRFLEFAEELKGIKLVMELDCKRNNSKVEKPTLSSYELWKMNTILDCIPAMINEIEKYMSTVTQRSDVLLNEYLTYCKKLEKLFLTFKTQGNIFEIFGYVLPKHFDTKYNEYLKDYHLKKNSYEQWK